MTAKQYADRNRKGSDWFSHDDQHDAPPPAEVEEPVTSDNGDAAPDVVSQTNRTQMIKPVCNSNQWYKYDQKNGGEKCEEVADDSSGASVVEEVKLRPNTGDRDSYCQRDKRGSSSEWFSHDHVAEGGTCSSPRVASKEGGDNASRMRGESENWFDHDANKKDGVPESSHMSKGRGNRPQSSEMHNIFHMDVAKN